MILLEEGKEKLEIVINAEGEQDLEIEKKGMKRAVADEELAQLERGRNVALRKMLRFRVRYFTKVVETVKHIHISNCRIPFSAVFEFHENDN
jgi:hypothetical protein